MSGLSVVVLPSWYKTEEVPLNGIFFLEQALAVAPLCKKIGIIYPEHRSLKSLSLTGLAKHYFQTTFEEDYGINIVRAHTWNRFPGMDSGYEYWVRTALRLFEKYSERYGRPNLVHAQCALLGGYAAIAIKDRWGVPYVVSEHNSKLAEDLDAASLRMAAAAYGSACEVLCVSTAIRDHIISKSLADPAKLRVVPNLVDIEFFTLPTKARVQDPFVLIAVGNLLTKKGFDYLLRAFKKAFDSDTGVRLKLVGRGPEEQALKSLVADLGIAGQVEFLGGLDRDRLREELWTANALVHPSHFETFGLAIVEAMATGLPVVATACGGPNDTVAEGTGFLVPVKDEGALAEKMKLLSKAIDDFDPSFIRKSVESRFAKEIVARQIVEAYEECAGGK